MNVLVLGADGFIGGAIAAALERRGHRVRAGVRRAASSRRVAVDFLRDLDPQAWHPRLAGMDAVVNAVGVFRAPAEVMQRVHVDAPVALFRACAQAGVRVLQVSALGAAPDAVSAFLRSKNSADDALLALAGGTVLRPSLVFGARGRSAQRLLALARAPLWPLPRGGTQRVQPVHIDDVADAAVALLQAGAPTGVVDAVGPRALRLRDYLQCLRRALGRGRGRLVAVPMPVARLGARVLARFDDLVDPAALDMLETSRPADAAAFARWLGRPPRPCRRFLEGALTGRERPPATGRGELQLLRLSLALLWIVSGLVSLFAWPVEQSLAWLHRTGVPAALAPAALAGAAGLDLLFGALLLFAPPGRRAYRLQMALVALYTILIAWRMPEFLAHPYAPIVKNLPVLAGLWLLHRSERDRWTT